MALRVARCTGRDAKRALGWTGPRQALRRGQQALQCARGVLVAVRLADARAIPRISGGARAEHTRAQHTHKHVPPPPSLSPVPTRL